MNIKRFLSAILITILLLTAFQCPSAEDNDEQYNCGAYTEQRAITDEEMELFNGVIAALDSATEYTPISVSTQVVAGINYKFLCDYDDKMGTTGNCFVIIFQPLQGEPELSEIKIL